MFFPALGKAIPALSRLKFNAATSPAFLMAAPVFALVMFAGCRHPVTPTAVNSPSVVPAAIAVGTFVGNAACAQCHASEFKKHKGSRHDCTLRDFTPARLGALMPAEGQIPQTKYSLHVSGNEAVFGETNGGSGDVIVPLAFGSGKTGMTYVTVLDSHTIAEMRLSYLPHQKTWFVTPGQEDSPPTGLGKMRVDDKAARCLSCHTIHQASDTLMPETRYMGVGCESCHGPGGEHSAAQRAGHGASAPMVSLASLGGKRLNDVCGKCHRTLQEVTEKGLDKANTQRFQPYGLALSRCFKESSDKLSCQTCHDPHTDVSQDTREYEQVCLRCHSMATSRPSNLLVPANPCPKNPKSGCITCHMPRKKVFQFSTLGVSMPDHYIRTHK